MNLRFTVLRCCTRHIRQDKGPLDAFHLSCSQGYSYTSGPSSVLSCVTNLPHRRTSQNALTTPRLLPMLPDRTYTPILSVYMHRQLRAYTHVRFPSLPARSQQNCRCSICLLCRAISVLHHTTPGLLLRHDLTNVHNLTLLSERARSLHPATCGSHRTTVERADLGRSLRQGRSVAPPRSGLPSGDGPAELATSESMLRITRSPLRLCAANGTANDKIERWAFFLIRNSSLPA